MRLPAKRSSSGFSFLELTLVTGMITVLASMSLITMKGARNALTLVGARRDAMGVLEVARAEATKRDINTQVIFNSSGTYTVQFSMGGTTATATHILPQEVEFEFPSGVTSLTVTYVPSGKATMKGNNGTLYSGFSFVSAAGEKTLTVSRAGDLSGSL